MRLRRDVGRERRGTAVLVPVEPVNDLALLATVMVLLASRACLQLPVERGIGWVRAAAHGTLRQRRGAGGASSHRTAFLLRITLVCIRQRITPRAVILVAIEPMHPFALPAAIKDYVAVCARLQLPIEVRAGSASTSANRTAWWL